MKTLLNWRYYIIFAVFSTAILSMLAAFGNLVEEMSIAKEMFLRFLYFGLSILAFCILKRVIDYWESRGEIPAITKLAEEEDDEWE